jgi:hypothetical protein
LPIDGQYQIHSLSAIPALADDEVIAGFRRGDEMNYTSFIESQM